MKSFIIKLLIITAIMEAIALSWGFFMPPKFVTPHLAILPIFFMAVTFMIHKAFVGALGLNPRQFVTRFMLVTTIKLLSFMALLLIYALINSHDAIQFLLSFFVMYVIYSAFEVTAVMNLNKRES